MKLNIKRTITEDVKPEEVIEYLLKDRGVENDESFLRPKNPVNIQLKDFFSDSKKFNDDIKKTFELLQKIKDKNESLVVYTDYDADGITGGTILWETLYLLGFNVMPYVPDRHLEGYGFSIKGIDAVKEKFNPSLIISVDHGIAAAEKISYAKSIGIPIIITDHHMKSDVSPDDALAVFHTDQLSGSGVSYFFSKEVFDFFRKGNKNEKKLEEYFAFDYMNLATIGTIADLVPLVGASRSIAKYGLESFRTCARPGIRHIFKEAGIEDKDITPYEIGFVIAPRINAIGRLEHAIDALRLLCTPNEKTAKDLASKIGDQNKLRQDLVKKALTEARTLVLTKEKQKNTIIVISSTEVSNEDSYWNEGIIGLIASKLTEEFYRPSIVLTKGDGFLKASVRSIPGFDVTSFLRTLQKYLVDVGGHSQAAGFTIRHENLEKFSEKVGSESKKIIDEKMLERKMDVDIALPLSLVTMKLAKLFFALKPFGMGNKEPVFMSDVEIVDTKLFGKKNEHLKIFVQDNQKKTKPIEMILFFGSEKKEIFKKGLRKEIVYKIDINTWNNREELRGKLIDVS